MTVTVKKQKPTSPGRRAFVKVTHSDLHKGEPFAKLLVAQKRSSGRNNYGRITAWQRGGGHKQRYRIIDWKRDKDGIPGTVKRIEYDPNRSSHIALISYPDGEYRYIIAPKELSVGATIQSGMNAPIEVGNCLPLTQIPIGSVVHCVELKIGKGAQLARSAGCSVQFLAREGKHATIRLKSGEMRKVLSACRAVIGEVGNTQHNLIKIGKAGRSRWMNKRPRVRGVAMNPVDHPLGGGEGRSSGGRPACTPWGIPEGIKTRRKRANSSKLIIRRRKNKAESNR